jgi:putative ABC transport system permease protein
MDLFRQDVRYGVRSLRKTPGFACASIATIALGIGATTALFSTVNAALLQPLPFPSPNDLYTLRTTITTGRMTSGLVAPVEFNALDDPNGPILHAAGIRIGYETILDNSARSMQIAFAGVTGEFFDTFNVPMQLGRSFRSDERPRADQPSFAVVLSSRLWRTAFGSDPNIVGKSVQFSRGPLRVVGVASPAFDTITNADVWFNMGMDPKNLSHIFEGYMRVRPGASPDRVQQELTRAADRLAKEYPVFNTNRVYVARPLNDTIVGDLRPTLIITFAATALLLLIACANVTNLLLARGAVRLREFAVRAALGASRGALVRQLLVESALLSVIGGMLGVLLARAGVRVLLAAAQSRLPRLEEVPFDWHVAVFAVVLTSGAGLVVGLLPGLRLFGTDVIGLLSESGRGSSGGRTTQRMLAAMIATEMAVAVTLVAGAGWLVRSFENLRAVRPGFAAERRIVVDVLLPIGRYRQPPQILSWSATLLDRLRHLNGVQAAGSASSLPLRDERDSTVNVTIAGDPQPYYPPAARWREVTPGWLEAMAVQLDAGRFFTNADRQTLAIVNEAFVDRYLRGTDPLRQQLVLPGAPPTPNKAVPIIGVVGDVKYASLRDPAEPTIYALGQFMNRQSVVVSTTLADPSLLVPLIRTEVERLDPLVPMHFELLPDVVSHSLSRQRLGMLLMLLFGGGALALAAVGVYGVIAYAVSQRVREMATRVALGASPRQIFLLTLTRGQAAAITGTGAGVITAYAGGRQLSNSLYEVRAADPVILATATLLVLALAVLATLVPARRAARVDPMIALRAE